MVAETSNFAFDQLRAAIDRTKRRDRLVYPSRATPKAPVLDELVNGFIQAMCRAVSLPHTPELAKLRVFIFRKERNRLICSHYWAPNPAREHVNVLQFEISTEVATKVAVVRAFIEERICKTKVEPLPANAKGVLGEVSTQISYVLAAPIVMNNGETWGIVDFDAEDQKGQQILQADVAEAAMYQFARHLGLLFSTQFI